MAEPTPITTPPAPASAPPNGSGTVAPEDLRLVLFGLPAAGKTSLLGALGEAANTQEHLLGGRLLDRSQGLVKLSHRLYDESAKRTVEEVAPYPVEYQPFSPDGLARLPTKVDAILMDCDGRVANDLLARTEPLADDSPEGTLAHEVTDADTLILVVDAAAPEAQLEEDFAEFNRFLKLMQRSRGQRAEVGGLPVFLVLTKCDLLARPGDSSVAWMDRIEQRKRDVDAHFREFLKQDEIANLPPQARRAREESNDEDLHPSADEGIFGRINLHVWATAVKRPALTGSPAKAREPYGVAELFRLSLTEAQKYRDRCERSSRRLVGTVAGAAGLVLVMLVLAVGLILFNRGSLAAALEARVEDFRFLDKGGPAERLKGSPEQLKQKQARLQSMRDDPLFPSLKPELREFVDERLEELQEYIPYLEKVIAERPPAAERTEEGLERSIDRLKKELAPRPGWEGTPAGLLVRQRLDAAEALRKAIAEVANWSLDSADSAAKLWTFAGNRTAAEIDWGDWAAQVEKVVDPARKPPFNEEEPIPGAPGSLLTYASAMGFDKVRDARVTWNSERAKLRRLLQICSALGLAPPSKERPDLLVIPRKFTLKEASARVAEMKKFYPDFQTTFTRDNLPDLLVPRVRQVARRQYQNLLIPAQAEVLRQLQAAGKGREETPARWEAVRNWLANPPELVSWRVLATVLVRLDDPTAEDPVAAFASFLGKTRFPIEIRTLTLEVPELRPLRPRAESRLMVMHPASNRQPALAFDLSGEPRRDSDRRVMVYTYRLSLGKNIVYRPGDKLWAELPLRSKERLVWADSRSMIYQMERLRNPPRLNREGAASLTEGRVMSDVRLAISPEDGVPRVPDLMPQVRLTD
jgi:hypothetical protein